MAACALFWSGSALAQSTAVIPGATVAPDRTPRELNRFERYGTAQAETDDESDAPSADVNFRRPFDSFSFGTGIAGSDAAGAGRRFVPQNARSTSRGRPNRAARRASPAREQPPLGRVTDSGPIGRRPQDRAIGANASAQPAGPPAGYAPIYTVPRPRRAHQETDPYAVLGFRKGGMIYYPALELLAGHDSNPGQTAAANSAAFWTIAPELRAQSDWSRHELRADLRGSYTGFSPDTTPTLSRPYFDGRIDGRIDVRRDTRIELAGRSVVSTDNPGSPNVQVGLRDLPVYYSFGGTAGVARRFNRLELAIRGSAERTEFQDSDLTDGTKSSNADRNYEQFGGTLRAGYETVPGVTPFVEGGVDTRRHDAIPDRAGFNRNSDGLTGRVGTTFALSRLLTGEVSVGYTRREYDDARFSDLKGLIGDASLVWNASALTTVTLTGASTVGETTVSGVSGIIYRDAGVRIDHAFRRWLVGTVRLGVGLDDYVGSEREDDRYLASIGLTYRVNRMVQLRGEARRDWRRSNVAGNDYTANVLLFGLRFQY